MFNIKFYFSGNNNQGEQGKPSFQYKSSFHSVKYRKVEVYTKKQEGTATVDQDHGEFDLGRFFFE